MVSEVFNQDNITCMSLFPDGFFDLVLVDPPYFSGPEKRRYYGKKVSSMGITRVYERLTHWELPDERLLNEVKRVSRYYIFFGCNYFNFDFHSGRIIWDKVNDGTDYSDAEIAATNLHDHVRIKRYMWNGAFQGESPLNGTRQQGNKRLNEKRIHPTQKPVNLYKLLLHSYAKKGFKILDTHMGSQSSRIACYDMGFFFYGIEKDPYCFDIGCKRFGEHTRQMALNFPQ